MTGSIDFSSDLRRTIITAETEMVRRRRASQEKMELEKMKIELGAIGQPYAQLLEKMKNDQQITVSLKGGSFLTIRKDLVYLEQGLLMAISNNSDLDLTGMGYAARTSEKNYSQRFLQMEKWQLMDFSFKKQTAYFWDKEALAKTDAYWEYAATVHLSGFDGISKNIITTSFNNKEKLISIPKSAWQQVTS